MAASTTPTSTHLARPLARVARSRPPRQDPRVDSFALHPNQRHHLAAGRAFTFPDGMTRIAKRPVRLDELLGARFGRDADDACPGLRWTRTVPSRAGAYLARPIDTAGGQDPRFVELRDGWVADPSFHTFREPNAYEWWPVCVTAGAPPWSYRLIPVHELDELHEDAQERAHAVSALLTC